MDTTQWTALTITMAAVLTGWISTLAQHNPTRRMDAIHYHATTARWGIGPVGNNTWRTAIGISIVLAGHGYALLRWPEETIHQPYRNCACTDCPWADRSEPDSRA